MHAVQLSRASLALLIIAVMVGGVALGSALRALATPVPTAEPTAVPPPPASATPSLPAADVAGEDLERLPRYPGSVRTEYAVSRDDGYELVALEFMAAATVEEVRLFYQQVIDEHGWERADIQYGGGEWTYVLVDGRTEALVEIEQTAGLIEVDLQVSRPLDGPTSVPQPVATPRPATPPVAPPPPPTDDDDGDDGDDGGGSDDGDDPDD